MLSGLALLTLSPLLWAQRDVSQTAPSAQFAQRYDSGNGLDVARKVVVSGAGHVYVTGSSRGASDLDYYARKYDKDGTVLWSARYDSGNGDDEAWDIAVDGSGNAYVTGRSKRSGGSQFDYVTIKYANSDGSQAWLSRLNGSGNGDDEAKAIGLDSSRNVFVTGWSKNSSANWDYWTVKLDGNDQGQLLWQDVYDNGGNDYANDLAVDAENNFVVTGASSASSDEDDLDYLTRRFLSNEQLRFSSRYAGIGDRDEAFAVATDSRLNVYITGKLDSTATGLPAKPVGTLKYSPIGQLCWYSHASSGGGYNLWHRAEGLAIAVVPPNRVLVAGSAEPKTTPDPDRMTDILAISYVQDPSGQDCPSTPHNNQNYVALLYDRSSSEDVGSAVAVDSVGNAYIAGWVTNSNGKKEYALAKYALWRYDQSVHDLSLCWLVTYRNSQSDPNGHLKDHKSFSVAVDADGNAVITGQSEMTNLDWATIKYCSFFGDVVPNGLIDDADLAAVLTCFGLPGGCVTVDVNGDGIVDDVDVAIVNERFGYGCP